MTRLDTALVVATPEGVEMTLALAGPLPRALAWLLDLLWRYAVVLIASMALGMLGRFGMGVFLILIFCMEWIVPAAFEVLYGGATPGKKALGIAVLNDDGTPVGWRAAFIRNLLRAVDFMPFLYAGGLVAMLFNRRFQRLGDLVAGTVVVYVRPDVEQRRIPEAEPQVPAVALKLSDKRAVLDFAERAPQLNPERADELARLATPLIDADSMLAPRLQLIAIANHLVGRRSG